MLLPAWKSSFGGIGVTFFSSCDLLFDLMMTVSPCFSASFSFVGLVALSTPRNLRHEVAAGVSVDGAVVVMVGMVTLADDSTWLMG